MIGRSGLILHAHVGLGKKFLLHLSAELVVPDIFVVLTLLLLLALITGAFEAR